MIIGLTGRIASGKGVIALYFEAKNFVYSSLSNAVREEAEKRGIEITRSNLQDLGNLVRNKEGAGAWARRIASKVKNRKDCVIDGIRNPAEIEELKKLQDFYLISVDAPKNIRYQRVLRRNKSSDPKDWRGFLKMDERDFSEEDPLGQQVGKCMESSDFKLINDSSLEEFHKKIEKVYNQILEN